MYYLNNSNMPSRTLTWIISVSVVLVLVISCVLVVTLAVPVWRNDDPVVSIQQGQVRGAWASDGDYAMYLGIPYALVNPENQFGDALAGPTFNGIFEANDDSTMCPQIEEFSREIRGSLDCLHVNVYVPRSASELNPLPVLVWIYGGGFRMGSAGRYTYGPQYLVRHDVILVTLNYRVGPYGFMCLDTPSVPGNSGFKDQRRGLEWVQNNIAAFGGDAASVTVFGESAGAMSLEFHILSPGSNGLFHKAILQSGSALVEDVVIYSRPSAPLEIAQYLNLQAETSEEALDVIKNVPPNYIMEAYQALGITFKPCIERVFEGVENVVTDFPDNILASHNYESIPMIIGYNSDEQLAVHIGGSMSDENYFDRQQDIVFRKVNAAFAFPENQQLERVTKIIHEHYFGTKPINDDTVFNLSDFDSDAHFLNPIERSISYHKVKSDLPIYQYVFAYSGEINFIKRRRNITVGGAVHADDIAYLFKQEYLPDENTPEDQRVIDQMTAMWTNFIKYGDPTPEVNELLPVRWPTVTDEREYLLIDSDLQIDRKPFHNRIAFWDLIFEAYGEYFRMIWSSCQGCPEE